VFLNVEILSVALPSKISSPLKYFPIEGSANLKIVSSCLSSISLIALPRISDLILTPPDASSNLTNALSALSFHILLVSSIALLTLTPVATLVPLGNSFIV